MCRDCAAKYELMSQIRHAPHRPMGQHLLAGVTLRPLACRTSAAGCAIDLFDGDDHTLDPVQWNFVASRPNTLRGVHVHLRHADYLTVARGDLLIGLHDMRPWSATHGQSAFVTLSAEKPEAITIPPGVAHGFYAAETTDHIYAVDQYWDPADELGCRWNDPQLKLDWPADNPGLSARDAEAESYALLAQRLVALHATQHHP